MSVDSGVAEAARRLVAVSAGTGDPSSTRMLTDRVAQRSIELIREQGTTVELKVIEIAPLAVEVARASVSGMPSDELRAAFESVAGGVPPLRRTGERLRDQRSCWS